MIDENSKDANQFDLENILGEVESDLLEEYEKVEVASKLADGEYRVIITKAEVLPINKNNEKTIGLKFSSKVVEPLKGAGKLYLYDFTLNKNNMTMLKKFFAALEFEYDLKTQLAAFLRLPGSELLITLNTNGQFQNTNFKGLVKKGTNLLAFLKNISSPNDL